MNRIKKLLLISMYATIFLVSFGFIMYSSLVSAFSETYRITLAQAGLVGSILCVGQLVVIFLNDMLARRLSRFALILTGVAVHLISMFWIAASLSFVSLCGAFFFNGAAISLLNVVMSAYISDLFGEERNSYLNIFHGIYGLGSLAGPLLPTIILSAGLNWQVSYLIVGGLSLLLAAFLVMVGQKAENPAKSARTEEGITGGEMAEVSFFRLLKNFRVFVVCLSAMIFMGFDMMISTYMSSYLELALDAASIAGVTITFYWAGSALGRLLYPLFFAKTDVRRFLIAVNGLTAALLFAGCLVRRPMAMLILVALVGLLSGVNFPLEIGMACAEYPENSVGATNAVSILGSLGGIIFPMLAGALMEKLGYESLLVQGGVMMLLLIVCMLLLIKGKGRENGHV